MLSTHHARHASRAAACGLWALVACTAMACGASGPSGVGLLSAAQPIAKAGPAATARLAYFAGMEELASGNYNQAMKYFAEVARSPRYVRHAALAKIRIGDAYFFDGRYEEAAQAYRSFVAQHGGDPNVPYARFRAAACYHARIPSGLFFEPPDHERDQSATKAALRELTAFLESFPTSSFAAQARQMRQDARQMLLAYQVYVADYYESRDKPRAVAWRLEHAIESYPTLAKTPELVWRMAESYRKAEAQADEARSYATYIESFPTGSQVAEAKRRLDTIRQSVSPSPTGTSD